VSAECVVELSNAVASGLDSLLIGRAEHQAAVERDSVAYEVEASTVPVGPGGADRYPVGRLAFADDLVQPMAWLPIRRFMRF